MNHIIACIDGSASAPAVCDYAAWASLSLEAPLTFLHVLDQRQYPVAPDLSGNIGLGSREHLLDELASLDEQRGKLALEQGRIMLAAAKERAMKDGVAAPESKQRHGDLLESLQELESETRLLVIGRQGESSGGLSQHVGSQLESVIRVMHRPILVTPTSFQKPQSAMLAFDGSATTRKGVEMLAASPLLKKRWGVVQLIFSQPGHSRENLADLACNVCSAMPGGNHWNWPVTRFAPPWHWSVQLSCCLSWVTALLWTWMI